LESYQQKVELLEDRVIALENLTGHRNKYRVGVEPLGVLNNINNVFYLEDSFEAVEVIFNGTTLTQGLDYDITSSKTVAFRFIPPSDSIIRFNYKILDNG
jgi:hypothetical protein